jgi:hypothetical protein
LNQFNPETDGPDIVSAQHPEWREHCLEWQQFLDAFEGGNRYKSAVYGFDTRGLPVRNLLMHKREYPADMTQEWQAYLGWYTNISPSILDVVSQFSYAPGMPGSDIASLAPLGDYFLRLARTPVPGFLESAVETHLSKIYGREIARDGPPDLIEWWTDVDGRGMSIDQWMEETVAPLLLVFGQIDLMFDHPPAPSGKPIATQADVEAYDLNRCVADVILPQNLKWWKIDLAGRYTECMVVEWAEGTTAGNVDKPESHAGYRYWNNEGSWLYNYKGECISSVPHSYGIVPIVRVFDKRKHRCKHIGKSRYSGIVQKQREYYNRDSELILSDTIQAHPVLQGPEDYVQADGSVPVGPGWLLPKKKNVGGSGATTYEGFEVVDFPKGAADSLRENMAQIADDVDRDACLTKPAGAAGTTGKTVAQSGVSKRLDSVDGNELLGKLSKRFAFCEEVCAEYAMTVMRDRPIDKAARESVKIVYPTVFDLFAIPELTDAATAFQLILQAAGSAPLTEGAILRAIVRRVLPGHDDDYYDALDAELDAFLATKAKLAEQAMEGRALTLKDAATPDDSLDAEGNQDGGSTDPNESAVAFGGGSANQEGSLL